MNFLATDNQMSSYLCGAKCYL